MRLSTLTQKRRDHLRRKSKYLKVLRSKDIPNSLVTELGEGFRARPLVILDNRGTPRNFVAVFFPEKYLLLESDWIDGARRALQLCFGCESFPEDCQPHLDIDIRPTGALSPCMYADVEDSRVIFFEMVASSDRSIGMVYTIDHNNIWFALP